MCVNECLTDLFPKAHTQSLQSFTQEQHSFGKCITSSHHTSALEAVIGVCLLWSESMMHDGVCACIGPLAWYVSHHGSAHTWTWSNVRSYHLMHEGRCDCLWIRSHISPHMPTACHLTFGTGCAAFSGECRDFHFGRAVT